jgi:signal transduction histidine kinase
VDGAVAAGLAVAAQAELWAGGWWTPFLGAVALAHTLPLALRRRFPFAVALAVTGAGVLALTALATDVFSFAQVVAFMLATYSAGAYATERRSWVALGVANASGVTNSVLAAERPEPGDVLFPVLLLTVPWLAGRALRLWRSRTAQLQRLTEDLAAEREARAALAVTAERARIAREMHDVLTQSLNTIVIHAEGAEEALYRDPALVRAPLATIQRTGRAALRETRRMLGVLRAPSEPETLEPLPAAGDLPALADEMSAAGLPVRLRFEGAPQPLPLALELSAYRIVQQALTNTVIHAGAARAEVVLRYAPDCLEIDVVDDGHGDGVQTAGSGYGLVGMRERAALFGGSLEAGPRVGGGFAVHARLPLDRAAP